MNLFKVVFGVMMQGEFMREIVRFPVYGQVISSCRCEDSVIREKGNIMNCGRIALQGVINGTSSHIAYSQYRVF
jgi:hypothetical protein